MTISNAFDALLARALLLGLVPPLFVAASALTGSEQPLLDLAAQFVAPALIFLMPQILIALWRRRWVVAGAGILIGSALLTALPPQCIRGAQQTTPAAYQFTVYSANLHLQNNNLPAIHASIDHANPDVVVVVEASRLTMASLVEVLGSEYRYRLFRSKGGTDGTVIASRYPIRRLPDPGPIDVSSVMAQIALPTGQLTVIGVHLSRPSPFSGKSKQMDQVVSLKQMASPFNGPLILAGDFNSVSTGRVGKSIRRELDVNAAPGWPGTYPAILPSIVGINIDQLYYTPGLIVITRSLGRRNGSDHRPVVTELAFIPNGAVK